ncbi:glycine cleavage system protein T [Amylibacter marinus]|uniref:Glycine cleavage system protein T n=1 Tax=Amylibacter marinus TaxID=1475483 RepID=A0ABQ5VTX3_9RHOB|nr:glycine cleavage T C-terminal barrel domain-containing protein [Amylibacter marinus]GLQ34622.1 glycine cleavage system protein T [Amylibacter marinus]
MAQIGPSTRLRVSPFYQATLAEGVTSFSPYNKMLMPVSYGDLDAEYSRLMQGVSQWDVSVERQVEITGPDATTLVQLISVRDLSSIQVGRGKYIPMCDHRGVLINDPVVLMLGQNHFWLSIGDDNILMWARAIAAERGLKVVVNEPDVSPMALQGPDAEAVMASLFGDWVKDLKYFWFRETELQGIPLVIQRSGYSKQGGFEIYLRDGNRGTELWNIVREAGAPWNIGPGAPNTTERIESGLLSYGGDSDDQTNPYEVRLGKYVNLDLGDEVVGITALRQINREGPKRHQLGVILGDQSRHSAHFVWYEIHKEGRAVGHMTNGTYSPRAKAMIGYALVSTSVEIGDQVSVLREAGIDAARIVDLPFF